MGFLKYVIVFMALFPCAWTANNSWCSRNPTDTLLMNQLVLRYPVPKDIINAKIVFPADGQTNKLTISAILISDGFTNSSGAINTVFSGGVGYKFATINLRSQFGQGINSTIQILGR